MEADVWIGSNRRWRRNKIMDPNSDHWEHMWEEIMGGKRYAGFQRRQFKLDKTYKIKVHHWYPNPEKTRGLLCSKSNLSSSWYKAWGIVIKWLWPLNIFWNWVGIQNTFRNVWKIPYFEKIWINKPFDLQVLYWQFDVTEVATIQQSIGLDKSNQIFASLLE